MIEKLRIQNFKCLRDVEIDFTPLTVLIGPNDSGKTSILEAMELLGRTTREPITSAISREVFRELAWRHLSGASLTWTVGGDIDYQLTCNPYAATDGVLVEEFRGPEFSLKKRPSSDQWDISWEGTSKPLQHPPNGTFTALARALQQYGFLFNPPDYFATTGPLRFDVRVLRRSRASVPDEPLAADGSNLVTVLDRIITGADERAIEGIQSGLRAAIPTLRRVFTPSVGSNGERAIEFALAGPETPPITIHSSRASDGALLVCAFLTLAYVETADIILIEEPENGLHPGVLSTIIELLRKISKGEVGNRPRQVVVTTHSPILLTFAKPEEVRIVQRDPENGTYVTPFTQIEDWEKLTKDFGLGELWWNLGEEGLTRKLKKS